MPSTTFRASWILPHFIFTTFRGRYCYHLHVRKEKTKALRVYRTCAHGSCPSKWPGLSLVYLHTEARNSLMSPSLLVDLVSTQLLALKSLIFLNNFMKRGPRHSKKMVKGESVAPARCFSFFLFVSLHLSAAYDFLCLGFWDPSGYLWELLGFSVADRVRRSWALKSMWLSLYSPFLTSKE